MLSCTVATTTSAVTKGNFLPPNISMSQPLPRVESQRFQISNNRQQLFFSYMSHVRLYWVNQKQTHPLSSMPLPVSSDGTSTISWEGTMVGVLRALLQPFFSFPKTLHVVSGTKQANDSAMIHSSCSEKNTQLSVSFHPHLFFQKLKEKCGFWLENWRPIHTGDEIRPRIEQFGLNLSTKAIFLVPERIGGWIAIHGWIQCEQPHREQCNGSIRGRICSPH